MIPIGLACAYALNHWFALNRSLNDGRLDIDNNAEKRAIRPLVVGRDNWLLAGSKRGGPPPSANNLETAACQQLV